MVAYIFKVMDTMLLHSYYGIQLGKVAALGFSVTHTHPKCFLGVAKWLAGLLWFAASASGFKVAA